MENLNKIIQSFWHGETLSQVERLCIDSFIANGHEFHLYTYNANLKGVPEKCLLMDANEIISSDRIFLDSRGTIATFSDYFRVKMLYLRGGWWVDMDIVCLKYFDFEQTHIFSSEYVNGEIFANIGCIKSPKGSAFLLNYIAALELTLEKKTTIPWGTFGPTLMNNLLKLYDTTGFLQEPEVFIMPKLIYSDNKQLMFYRLFNHLKIEEISEKLENSYSIHLYNELWRLNAIDKSQRFREGSLLDYLQKRVSHSAND
ncbi:glycosyltransferase [Sphingobacterium sp. SYP-B4668]|uniref:glycosyltransferase n=1 Tax=Sphingobacterium sp. SYP-B4668 TaxID=2996035 RepID=UPI0022DE6232|nr:glycosyltransferase [Sphingobacterium sp. SYP-B4668]